VAQPIDSVRSLVPKTRKLLGREPNRGFCLQGNGCDHRQAAVEPTQTQLPAISGASRPQVYLPRSDTRLGRTWQAFLSRCSPLVKYPIGQSNVQATMISSYTRLQ